MLAESIAVKRVVLTPLKVFKGNMRMVRFVGGEGDLNFYFIHFLF